MSSHKKILDIEKKFDTLTSSHSKEFEDNLSKREEQLKKEFEDKKIQLKEDLAKDLENQTQLLEEKAERLLETAISDSNLLKKEANVEGAVDFLVGEVKNV